MQVERHKNVFVWECCEKRFSFGQPTPPPPTLTIDDQAEIVSFRLRIVPGNVSNGYDAVIVVFVGRA